MAIETKIFDVLQGTSGKYTAQIVDENGAGLPVASITTAILTLYNTADETVINTRFEQDVKNTNDVTIDSSGNLEWLWTPDDMPRFITTRAPELHTALWKITWSSGNKQILHEVSFRVHRILEIAGP